MKDKTDQNQKGRGTEINPASVRYTFRMTEKENADFLTLMEKSGLKNKSKFILARIFSKHFRVIVVDKSTFDYYTRLTAYVAEIRKIGINYNQVVRSIHSNYTKERAAKYLSNLTNLTRQLVDVSQKIETQTEEVMNKWSQNKCWKLPLWCADLQ